MQPYRLTWVVLSVCVLSGCAVVWPRPPAPEGAELLIRGAQVVDLRGGGVLADRDLFLGGGRILEIRPTGSTRPQEALTEVDAAGKFVIPGLWDMHVHWMERETLPLFVANGVLGIRQMLGASMHYQWRAQGIEGTPAAPHQVLGSPLIDGPDPFWPGSVEAATPAQAEQIVQVVAQSQAAFIKPYSKLSREAYLALASAAAEAGLPLDGHLPPSVSWQEAIAAGQRSVEHLTEIEFALSARGEELLPKMARLYQPLVQGRAGSAVDDNLRARHKLLEAARATSDPQRQTSLLNALAKRPVWQCPTLAVAKAHLSFTSGDVDDPRLRYLGEFHRAQFARIWRPSEADEELRPARLRDLAFKQQVLARMYAAGVPILAGTDVGNPGLFPGFSLHDELALLVEAGLPPLAALRAATTNPAKMLGQDGEFGYVEPGLRADLLILNGNPLQDIGQTRQIDSVIVGGEVLTRAALDEILSTAQALAARPHVEEALLPVLQNNGVEAVADRYAQLQQERAHEFNFTLHPGPYLLANALIEQQRWQDLLHLTERVAHGALSDHAIIHESLGDLYQAFKRPEDARTAYQRALQLAPGAPGLMLKLEPQVAELP